MFKGTEQSYYAQAEVLGTDRPCRGPLEFQRQRADIADGQTLTTSQYYLHRYKKPRAALAETMHGVQSYPAERPVPPWSRQDQPPAGGGLLQRNTGSQDPTSNPQNIQNYELASPGEAEGPGGLSGVAR